MGYISRTAAVLLWIVGLVITTTACYLVYSDAVQFVPPFQGMLVGILLTIAWAAILGFWAFVLSRGVSSDK
jgi:Na+-translocating ferredoxin:NAD+ oxidoreductase RnfD subunit